MLTQKNKDINFATSSTNSCHLRHIFTTKNQPLHQLFQQIYTKFHLEACKNLETYVPATYYCPKRFLTAHRELYQEAYNQLHNNIKSN